MRVTFTGEIQPLEGQPAPIPSTKPAYREGKKPLTTWINEMALRQFKAIAAEEGRTVQDLVEEMLNREFVRRGKAPLA